MNEFIKLVREMRNVQKEYFKTRDKNVLLKSKELERKVDSFLTQQVINKQHYSNKRSKYNNQRSDV